jgi:hypothetical protein
VNVLKSSRRVDLNLTADPLQLDAGKHPKANELMPMKEKTRGFIYDGQWINKRPDGYGKIYLPNGEYF